MELKVENIKCGGCANSIKNSLLKFEGVKDIKVDIENGTIQIDGEVDEDHKSQIKAKLHSMGYPEPGQGSGFTTASSFVSCMIGRVTS